MCMGIENDVYAYVHAHSNCFLTLIHIFMPNRGYKMFECG